jgi:hypothetical protein
VDFVSAFDDFGCDFFVFHLFWHGLRRLRCFLLLQYEFRGLNSYCEQSFGG